MLFLSLNAMLTLSDELKGLFTKKAKYHSKRIVWGYTVMHSDRNSSKTGTFHKPTAFELQV